MNETEAYDALHQIAFLNDQYEPPGKNARSTFLVLQLVEQPGGWSLSGTIVDPAMKPKRGDATEFLRLRTVQRIALHMKRVIMRLAKAFTVTDVVFQDREEYADLEDDDRFIHAAYRAGDRYIIHELEKDDDS